MEKEEIIVHLGKNVIKLTYSPLEDELDVDELTCINYANIYGEAITVSALLNKVGIMKAEAEHSWNRSKLECEVFEAELRKRFRREAAMHEGKFQISKDEWIKLTENSLNDAVLLDEGYKLKKSNVSVRQRSFNILDSLFWSVSSKDKKLNNLIKGIDQDKLGEEIIEGSINTILIKKNKSIFAQ